ncbi:MAG: hypothetical protein ACRDSP_12900 [Pseudonocardiaceae bacterium]
MSEGPGGAVHSARECLVRGPDLYRNNIFRVTCLPVDATPRMVSRQREKFRVAFSVGTPPPCGKGPLRLDPAPDENAVQTAFEGFRDPERRLVDELFWFWRTETPQAVTAATSATREISADPAEVHAYHDRAVAAHCAALDLEHAGRQRPLSAEERTRRDGCWAEAARRWATLADTPQIWDRLRVRVAEIDDPRLTADMVDDVREDLLIRLVTMHAELALDLAPHDEAEAQRQRGLIDRFIREAAQDTDRVDAALRAVLAPALRRIETTCRKARSAAGDEPADGCATGTRALDQLRPALGVVGAVLGPSHPTVRAARDQMAFTLNRCAIQQSNLMKSTDAGADVGFATVLSLLQEAKRFACLATTTNLITKNIDIVNQLHLLAAGRSRSSAPSVPPRSPSPRSAAPVPPPLDPRTGQAIFAELRERRRGPWAYVDQLCREGRPNLAHDALALWSTWLAKDRATTNEIDTLLAKPAPFVARMKRIPARATVLGCGVGIRHHRRVQDGEDMMVQYLVVFFIPLIPLAAYLVRRAHPATFDIVGKVPLGMGPRLWRKLLTLAGMVTLAVVMFDGYAVIFALLCMLVLRMGIHVCKVTALRTEIRQSMAR